LVQKTWQSPKGVYAQIGGLETAKGESFIAYAFLRIHKNGAIDSLAFWILLYNSKRLIFIQKILLILTFKL
jgi:hypothetical protein